MPLFLIKNVIILTLLSLLVQWSASQNCHIEEINDDESIVEVQGILESTPAKTIIWKSNIQNVISSTTFPTPQTKYLSGLRWSSRYEYQATDVFTKFITSERKELLERNTTFVCADGKERQIYFKFNLIDENNNPPGFTKSSYSFTVHKSDRVDNETFGAVNDNTSTRIEVRDMDLNPLNAKVQIFTTLPSIFNASSTLDHNFNPIKDGYVFYALLSINWDKAPLGNVNFDIVADDNRFVRRIPVSVMILP